MVQPWKEKKKNNEIKEKEIKVKSLAFLAILKLIFSPSVDFKVSVASSKLILMF